MIVVAAWVAVIGIARAPALGLWLYLVGSATLPLPFFGVTAGLNWSVDRFIKFVTLGFWFASRTAPRNPSLMQDAKKVGLFKALLPLALAALISGVLSRFLYGTETLAPVIKRMLMLLVEHMLVCLTVFDWTRREGASKRLVLGALLAVGWGLILTGLLEVMFGFSLPMLVLDAGLPMVKLEEFWLHSTELGGLRAGLRRIRGSFGAAQLFAGAILVVTPWFAWKMLHSPTRRGRATYTIGFLALTGLLISSTVRAAYISFAPVMLLIIWWMTTRRNYSILMTGVVIIGVLLLSGFYSIKDLFLPWGSLESDWSWMGRVYNIRAFLDEVADSPVFGHGVGSFSDPESLRYSMAKHYFYAASTAKVPTTDNVYLCSLLEMGIIGLGALLWLMIGSTVAFACGARRSTGDRQKILIACAVTNVAIASYGMGADAIGFVYIGTLWYTVLGLGYGTLLPILGEAKAATGSRETRQTSKVT